MNRFTNKHSRLILLVLALMLVLPTSLAFAQGDVQPDAAELSPASPEVSFTGAIESIPDDFVGEWQIGGQTVQVKRHTRFLPNREAMEVGAQVRVIAIRHRGQLVATHIQLQREGRPRYLRGKIENIDAEAGQWTVAGELVLLNENTRVMGDAPDVGDDAYVWGRMMQDGLHAERILVKDPRPSGRQVAFRGEVVAITDGVWTVRAGEQDRTVLTNESTRILDKPGVGDRVGVKGHLQEDQTILARLIVNLDAEHNEIPFSGFVTEILPDTQGTQSGMAWIVERPALGDHEAQAWTVLITEDTKSRGDLSEVEIGAWVKGIGDELEAGTVQALAIEVTRPPSLRFGGAVEALPDPSAPDFPQGDWVIGGKTIRVTERTRVRGNVPELGDEVLGSGMLQLDGSIEALVLAIRR